MRFRLVALFVALGLVACASLPPKEKAVYTLQSVQNQLELLQDTERRLCNPAAFDADPTQPITACAGPVSEALQLTTAKHQQFAGAMATAYSAQRRLGAALMLWRTGAPEPPELATLEGQVRSALVVARSLAATDDQRELVRVGESLLEAVLTIAGAVRN